MLRLLILVVLLTTSCSAEQINPSSSNENSAQTFILKEVKNHSEIDSNDIYTFTCEMIEQKPSISTPNCGDFGEAVFDIKWETWSADGAIGTGIYSLNNCEPNCADGTRLESPAKVRLSGLKTDGSRYFLTEFSYVAEKIVMTGRPKSGGWDSSEFYVNVPDMRSDG